MYADGDSIGDGLSFGKCWDDDANGIQDRKCLSTGECNACKIISNAHEGCDIYSTEPVCDADSTTVEIEDSAVAKLAKCVACKNTGKYRYLSLMLHVIMTLYLSHKCNLCILLRWCYREWRYNWKVSYDSI